MLALISSTSFTMASTSSGSSKSITSQSLRSCCIVVIHSPKVRDSPLALSNSLSLLLKVLSNASFLSDAPLSWVNTTKVPFITAVPIGVPSISVSRALPSPSSQPVPEINERGFVPLSFTMLYNVLPSFVDILRLRFSKANDGFKGLALGDISCAIPSA